MSFVGVDLHKKVIQICVIRLEGGKRKVVCSRRFSCQDVAGIVAFFQNLGPFQVVVEATASYEWFVRLVEPLADRVVLAHPKKLRVIAESTHKTDKLDARILAELLALDMIPQAYRPTPRQRDYRVLVRHRYQLQGETVSLRSKIRRILSNYNADREDLFTRAGLAYLEQVAVSPAERWVLADLVGRLKESQRRLKAADQRLAEFAADPAMPIGEREARAVLASFPCVGPVTIDVVLSELADARRFHSQKAAAAYAGLAPGVRQSSDKVYELHITKEGSRLLRWALIQLAWRLVNRVAYWRGVFEPLRKRTGKKKAIVAVARRALCVMIAMLQSGQAYRFGGAAGIAGQPTALGLSPTSPKVEQDARRTHDPVEAAPDRREVQPRQANACRAKSARTRVARDAGQAHTPCRGAGKRREADPTSASAPPSGPAPALGSHPCVALSSGQAHPSKARGRRKVKPPQS